MLTINGSLLFYLIIGLVQAGLLLTVRGLDQPGLIAAVTAMVLVAGFNLQLLGADVRHRRTWIGIAVLTLLFAAISGALFIHAPHDIYGDSWLRTSWILGAIASGYIATAFITAWSLTAEPDRPQYETLFQCAWNNMFIVLLAALLCGLFWLLLLLCGGLFSMLGIPLFSYLFSTTTFIYISVALLFSLGMRMGRENKKVIATLRGIFLALCRFLMPMAALIVVLFTATLPFTGLQPIWKTGHSTPILLCLVGVSVILINGVFQDGRQSNPYARWLTCCINASLLCLPLLAALAGYSSWLRIEQYGVTPARFAGMVLAILAGLHTLAATYAVFARQSVWLGSLRTTNPLLALITFVVVVAIHSPWLSPLELSARNQVQRLLDGRTPVAEFDAQNLRNGLGEVGREYFDRLLAKVESEQLFDDEARKLLLSNLQVVGESANAKVLKQRSIVWIGPRVEGSDQFAEPEMDATLCPVSGCLLWAVDLDGDGKSEVLQISTRETWSSIKLFSRSPEGKWVQAGVLEGNLTMLKVVSAIRAGKVSVFKPRYQHLNIDGVEFVPRLE
ncbi:MAG: DUF4153 domain-containing protein [Pseudomonas sp.]